MRLDEALASNRGIGPGFHILRHALSGLIILAHCRSALVVHDVPGSFGDIQAGILTASKSSSLLLDIFRPGVTALVGMFFALSGFLVAGSALRTGSIRVFLSNRGLRIVPALSVEVLLSALILGPFVTTLNLSGYFADPQFFRYFGNIVGHITYFLPGVFEDLPWPKVVNGTLWTLPAELACYALMVVAMALGLLKRTKALTVLAVSIGLGWSIAYLIWGNAFVVTSNSIYSVEYIIFLFVLGAIAFCLADRIMLRFDLFVAAGLAYWLLLFTDHLAPLSGFPLVYCMIYVGMLRFPWWDHRVKADYSYGMYLYGFPFMQLWVWLFLPLFGGFPYLIKVGLLFAATMVATILFSAWSWKYIEKPALDLKRYLQPSKDLPSTPPI